MQTYICKIQSSMYPNGQWMTFETTEGKRGVNKHISEKGWVKLSNIERL